MEEVRLALRYRILNWNPSEKYSSTLKLTDLLPEKTSWNLVQGAAGKRSCATQ